MHVWYFICNLFNSYVYELLLKKSIFVNPFSHLYSFIWMREQRIKEIVATLIGLVECLVIVQISINNIIQYFNYRMEDHSGITGAFFMAVCRGKVSEGLDFTDDNARAVIAVSSI